ncbi:MAG: serine/threonine-protein kinase [Planctomycetota bacterium]
MSDESQPPDSTRPHDPATGDSILESIARRTGRAPRTSLHDSSDDDVSPIVDPRAGSIEEQLSKRDRAKYRVIGEIASGGMGVVLRGHDTELGRDVAMKVVHEGLADRPEVVERFVEEAQIGGQLQHPGIVPVYELGLIADERPYFTMKLVKGHTLAKLFSRRRSPDDERARFLAIFESVCQTMAYAHSKGVVHRDLKPANVMVGSFGEVQVVDWGLSKVLARGGVADELAARDTAKSLVETVRSGPSTDSDSMVGSVIGTPGYMAPEQARGDIECVDERADVFALGAILCELLTGAPPYVATEGRTLVQMAALAELDGARERLAACAAPAGLVKLCESCLMPAPAARPSSAQEVADAVRDHIAGLENAAHEAQLTAAEERATAERSRRQMQAVLGAAALALVIGGGLWWTTAQRAARRAQLAEGFEEARTIALEREQEGAYAQAVDAARAGLALLESRDASDELVGKARALVERTEGALADARTAEAARERDERLLEFLEDAAMRAVDTNLNAEPNEINESFRAAFQDYGLDLTDDGLADRVDELRDTPMALPVALGAEGWIQVLRQMDENRSDDVELLTSIALDLDDDPLRTEARLASASGDANALIALAEEALAADAPPQTLLLVGSSLVRADAVAEARLALIAAAERFPDDFLANYTAGVTLIRGEMEGNPLIAQYLRAAIALRPDLPTTYIKLGDHYRSIGNSVLAARYTQKGMSMTSYDRWNPRAVAEDLMASGEFARAIEWFEREREQYGSNVDLDGIIMGCRAALGEVTPDAYFEWSLAQTGRAPTAALGPAYVLTTRRSEEWYDPAKALELLQPFAESNIPVTFGFTVLARAHIGVGDGASALEALSRIDLSEDAAGLANRSGYSLLLAAALRLEGRDVDADHALETARWLRDTLVAGDEEAWSKSSLIMDFEDFEPVAAGD